MDALPHIRVLHVGAPGVCRTCAKQKEANLVPSNANPTLAMRVKLDKVIDNECFKTYQDLVQQRKLQVERGAKELKKTIESMLTVIDEIRSTHETISDNEKREKLGPSLNSVITVQNNMNQQLKFLTQIIEGDDTFILQYSNINVNCKRYIAQAKGAIDAYQKDLLQLNSVVKVEDVDGIEEEPVVPQNGIDSTQPVEIDVTVVKETERTNLSEEIKTSMNEFFDTQISSDGAHAYSPKDKQTELESLDKVVPEKNRVEMEYESPVMYIKPTQYEEGRLSFASFVFSNYTNAYDHFFLFLDKIYSPPDLKLKFYQKSVKCAVEHAQEKIKNMTLGQKAQSSTFFFRYDDKNLPRDGNRRGDSGNSLKSRENALKISLRNHVTPAIKTQIGNDIEISYEISEIDPKSQITPYLDYLHVKQPVFATITKKDGSNVDRTLLDKLLQNSPDFMIQDKIADENITVSSVMGPGAIRNMFSMVIPGNNSLARFMSNDQYPAKISFDAELFTLIEVWNWKVQPAFEAIKKIQDKGIKKKKFEILWKQMTELKLLITDLVKKVKLRHSPGAKGGKNVLEWSLSENSKDVHLRASLESSENDNPCEDFVMLIQFLKNAGEVYKMMDTYTKCKIRDAHRTYFNDDLPKYIRQYLTHIQNGHIPVLIRNLKELQKEVGIKATKKAQKLEEIINQWQKTIQEFSERAFKLPAADGEAPDEPNVGGDAGGEAPDKPSVGGGNVTPMTKDLTTANGRMLAIFAAIIGNENCYTQTTFKEDEDSLPFLASINKGKMTKLTNIQLNQDQNIGISLFNLIQTYSNQFQGNKYEIELGKYLVTNQPQHRENYILVLTKSILEKILGNFEISHKGSVSDMRASLAMWIVKGPEEPPAAPSKRPTRNRRNA